MAPTRSIQERKRMKLIASLKKIKKQANAAEDQEKQEYQEKQKEQKKINFYRNKNKKKSESYNSWKHQELKQSVEPVLADYTKEEKKEVYKLMFKEDLDSDEELRQSGIVSNSRHHHVQNQNQQQNVAPGNNGHGGGGLRRRTWLDYQGQDNAD